MRGDTPRNGTPDAALDRPVPDAFHLLRRRAFTVIAGLIADGVLPADPDGVRVKITPQRLDAPGDALVHAGIGPARGARDGASRLIPALAEGLRIAPEVEAVAVARGGTLVLTFRPATLFAAVADVLRSCGDRPSRLSLSAREPHGDGGPAPAPSSRRGRDTAALLRARIAASAEIRDALGRMSWVDPRSPALFRGDAEGDADRDRARASTRARSATAPARAGPPPMDAEGGDGGASRGLVAPVSIRGRVPADGDVLAWIGRDAFRFAVAARRSDEVLVLDLDVLGDRTRDDPSFWVRYAHARARSVLRGAAAAFPGVSLSPGDLAGADFSRSTHDGEVRLARLVARNAHVVAGGSPQRLVAHLRAVAEAVHAQWIASKQQPQSRFVNEELTDLVEARLGLVTAAALVLRSGLDIIGIAAPDEMP